MALVDRWGLGKRTGRGAVGRTAAEPLAANTAVLERRGRTAPDAVPPLRSTQSATVFETSTAGLLDARRALSQLGGALTETLSVDRRLAAGIARRVGRLARERVRARIGNATTELAAGVWTAGVNTAAFAEVALAAGQLESLRYAFTLADADVAVAGGLVAAAELALL